METNFSSVRSIGFESGSFWCPDKKSPFAEKMDRAKTPTTLKDDGMIRETNRTCFHAVFELEEQRTATNDDSCPFCFNDDKEMMRISMGSPIRIDNRNEHNVDTARRKGVRGVLLDKSRRQRLFRDILSLT